MKPKADYGIDAPGVIGKLIISGILCLGIILSLPSFVKGDFKLGWLFLIKVVTIMGACLIITGLLGILSSKAGKIKERERILNLLKITGSENILDVGCGKGLYLIGAAQRLSTGKVTGIDIWQSADLSGNHIDNTLRNANLEGVSPKIQIKTADMKEIPFPNDTFDLILSSFAVHNIGDKTGRQKALSEIIRVLKPGGKLCIIDIMHIDEYLSFFSENGLAAIKKFPTRLLFPVATVIIGLKNPH